MKSRFLPFGYAQGAELQKLEAGCVIATIDECDFAGDAAGEGAREEERGVADFELVDVAVKGSSLLNGGEDAGKVADAASGESLDGASGDGVDADVLRAEIRGEVADDGLEGSFRRAHDVVVREDLVGAIVGEGEDRAALGHERLGGAGERNQRIGADIEGDAEVFTGGLDDSVLDVWGEANGVDEDVELSVCGFELLEDGVDVGIDGDIAAEGLGAGEF